MSPHKYSWTVNFMKVSGAGLGVRGIFLERLGWSLMEDYENGWEIIVWLLRWAFGMERRALVESLPTGPWELLGFYESQSGTTADHNHKKERSLVVPEAPWQLHSKAGAVIINKRCSSSAA